MAVISTAVCSDFGLNSSLRLIKFFFTKKGISMSLHLP